MKYPTVTLGGQQYDIYDLAKACGVDSPPLFNAFKKIIRRGNGAKTERQDLEEVKQSVARYLRDLPSANQYHGTDIAKEMADRAEEIQEAYQQTQSLLRTQIERTIPGEDELIDPETLAVGEEYEYRRKGGTGWIYRIKQSRDPSEHIPTKYEYRRASAPKKL